MRSSPIAAIRKQLGLRSPRLAAVAVLAWLAVASAAGAADRHPRPAARSPLRQPEVGSGEPAGRARRRTTAPPGCSSARVFRSRSRPNSTPGARSATRTAPKAGCCIRFCRAGAPPSWRPGRRTWCCRSTRKPSQTPPSVANLQPGVLGNVKKCDGTWCRIFGDGFDGYEPQSNLWGVYPGEQVD